jgi:hypothetical protein
MASGMGAGAHEGGRGGHEDLGKRCRGHGGENGGGAARQSWEAEARCEKPGVRGWASGRDRERGQSTLLS